MLDLFVPRWLHCMLFMMLIMWLITETIAFVVNHF
jgi:hypothetical protein